MAESTQSVATQGVLKFKIDGYEKQFEVRELTLRQIIELMKSGDNIVNLETFGDYIKGTLLPLVSNIEMDELLDMRGSQVEDIVEKVKEVNKSFFVLAEEAGLADFLMQIKRAVLSDFSRLLVISLKPDTPKSSTTDTHTSSQR